MIKEKEQKKMTKKMTKKKAEIDYVQILLKEFKTNYPDLDVTKLKPTFPESLKQVDLTNKEIAQIGFDPVVLSIVCGTVFGDSNLAIQKDYKRARLSYRHSTRQSDWFFWKTLCGLKEFTTETGIQFQLPDGYQVGAALAEGEKLGKLKLSSLVNDKLTALHAHIAPKNVKTIQRYWLNHMNNYFLMTLWLDDGSLTGPLGRQGLISAGKMPKAQAELLADYLTTVWKVESAAREYDSKSDQVQIVINDQENLMKFLRIIAPIIPVKSMLYKVCFFPNNVSLQERWASELKDLVRPDWHDEIDKIYKYKTVLSSSIKKIEIDEE